MNPSANTTVRKGSTDHRCTDRRFFDNLGDNMYLCPTCSAMQGTFVQELDANEKAVRDASGGEHA
jgi:hypothetical protein